MKALLTGLGILLLLAGAVFVLQGINVLPGSFMTGQTFWAFTGAACLVVGVSGCSTWGFVVPTGGTPEA